MEPNESAAAAEAAQQQADAASAEATQAAAVAAAAAEQQAAPTDEELGRPPKTSREAIYAKHREVREVENAEDPERMAASLALAGRGPEEQQQAAAGGQKETVALDSRMVKLNVDGQETERPIEEVLEAGRRTLQKESSADLKLRQASASEQLAAQRLAEAEQIKADALKNSGGLPSSGARHDDASSRLSEQDAGESTEATLREGAEQARNVLFDEGDSEKAGQVLLATSRKVVVERTNAMFLREFDAIASDPVAMRRAIGLMNAEMSKTKDFAEFPVIATRIGNQLLREQATAQVATAQAEQQQTDSTTQQQDSTARVDKTTQKMRLPIMPSRAGTKTLDSKPAAVSVRQTPGQIVQEMKRARGQLRG
jgi:hypothetical protein